MEAARPSRYDCKQEPVAVSLYADRGNQSRPGRSEMPKRNVVQKFLVAFLCTTTVVFVVLRTELIERVSYSIESGRLRAMSEAVPSADLVDQFNAPNRIVANLVTPAVVQITTVRTISLSESLAGASGVSASGEATSDSSDFEALRPRENASNDSETGGQTFFEAHELGSGFIFDAKHGYILTNHHVTDGASEIRVHLDDGRRLIATMVGSDAATDLAVLQISADRLHQVEFGDSGSLGVGDDVFAIGNPFGLEGTFSRGIVSALGRSTVMIRDVAYQGFIQTDAVINPGNSGGPLVNRRGQVIGVNTAIVTNSGEFDGVGFAIPSSRIVRLIPKLIHEHKIVRGFLGVSTVDLRDDRDVVEVLGWDGDYGVVVKYVEPDSPADQAGLRRHDVLIEVDGQRITSVSELFDTIAMIKPGTSANVVYWREGEQIAADVALVERRSGN